MSSSDKQLIDLDRKKKKLERAVASCGLNNISEGVFEDVLEFLTYYGESAPLANWVKDVYLSQGVIQEPCVDLPPLVSIIIPCHNYGHYLRDCVESVLMQTMTNWEIIIVDDGSVDDTPEVAGKILSDYPNHRIRYFSQECRGIVQPRNRGVTLAKGEFILPLDADDLIAPTFLERTLAVLKDNEKLGYVSTRALFFGSSNKIWPSEPFVPLALLVTNQQVNTTLYRKAMWKDIGGYEKEMIHGYMDWEFWIHCTKAGWVGTQLEAPLFLYRRKDDSVVMKAKQRDINIKTQIAHLHPEIYDPAKLATAGDDLNKKNWIPPSVLRNPLLIPPYPGAKPEPAPLSLSEYMSLQTYRRVTLNALSAIYPNHAMIFMGKDAGRGAMDAFTHFFELLSQKINTMVMSGKSEEASAMAMQLLARYPLYKDAVVKALSVISKVEPQASYQAGKFYFSIFVGDNEMSACLGKLVHNMILREDNLHNLGLLEGAAQFAPQEQAIKDELAAMKERLGFGVEKTGKTTFPSVWYVTDGFGYGHGGINGASLARTMTLSSILQNKEGVRVCIITPLHEDIAELIAAFYSKLEKIDPSGNYRIPEWHCTVNSSGKAGFVAPISSDPSCIITEGVRLSAYNYLKTLPVDEKKSKIFIHHTSPEQFKDTFTGKDMFPELLKALNFYEYNVCVSSNVMDEWKQIDGLIEKKWIYIPNCAPNEENAARILQKSKKEVRLSLGLPENSFIGLCLASVQVRKGQDVLLRQLHIVIEKMPDALFLFVGPVLWDWQGKSIVDYAKRNFTTKNVRIIGPKQNSMDYIHAADCLILPSREEALPLTILEAMLLGKPSVASDVNGIPELIVPEETGLLFSHNAPEDLAGHIIRLGADPFLAEQMGKTAQARYFEKFSRKHHVARWRELLESQVHGNHSPQW